MIDLITEELRSRYGLPGAEVSLIGQGQAQNAIYLVASKPRRVAKHYGPYYHVHGEWVRSEVRLVAHLSEKGLPVAAPVPTLDGLPFVMVDDRPLVVFEWASGSLQWPAAPENAKRLGGALASMHLASDDLAPDGTERVYDIDRLVDAPVRLLEPFLDDCPEVLDGLRRFALRLRGRLEAIKSITPAFGFIHGDIHQGNCFFQGDDLVIFDFALSGIGYRTYDLTGFLWPMRDQTIEQPRMRECCDAFLAGYREVRPLSPAEEAAIPAFVQIRSLWELGDWLDAGTGGVPAQVIEGAECMLRQLQAVEAKL